MDPLEALNVIGDRRAFIKVVIETVRQIWKERDSVWYTYSLQLLDFINRQAPNVSPQLYNELMINLKMKVLVHMYILRDPLYKQCIEKWFNNEDPLSVHAKNSLYSINTPQQASKLLLSEGSVPEYNDTVRKLEIYLNDIIQHC